MNDSSVIGEGREALGILSYLYCPGSSLVLFESQFGLVLNLKTKQTLKETTETKFKKYNRYGKRKNKWNNKDAQLKLKRQKKNGHKNRTYNKGNKWKPLQIW